MDSGDAKGVCFCNEAGIGLVVVGGAGGAGGVGAELQATSKIPGNRTRSVKGFMGLGLVKGITFKITGMFRKK